MILARVRTNLDPPQPGLLRYFDAYFQVPPQVGQVIMWGDHRMRICEIRWEEDTNVRMDEKSYLMVVEFNK